MLQEEDEPGENGEEGEEQGAGGEREEGLGKMKTQRVGGFFFFLRATS